MKKAILFITTFLIVFVFPFNVSFPSLDVNTDAVSAATSKPTTPTTPTKPTAPVTPSTPVTTPTIPSTPTAPSSGNGTVTQPTVTWSSNPSSWALSEVSQANSYGLTNSDILSQYNRPITRLEFVQLIMNQYYASGGIAAGSTATQPFSDTTDAAVSAAYELGIIHGQGSSKFHPENQLTRQEAAVIMFREWKLLNAAGGDPSVYPGTFKDSGKISDWALDAVRYMNQIGVMVGSSDGSINPTGNATREQAIILVLRNYEHQAKLNNAATSADAISSATSSGGSSGDEDDREEGDD